MKNERGNGGSHLGSFLYGVLFFMILLTLAKGCWPTTTEKTVSVTPQPCPVWTANSGQCQLTMVKTDIESEFEYELGQNHMARMTTINGDLLVESGQVEVKLEDGRVLDLKTTYLTPGTYIVTKNYAYNSGLFKVINVRPDQTGTVTLEIVRFYSPTTGE